MARRQRPPRSPWKTLAPLAALLLAACRPGPAAGPPGLPPRPPLKPFLGFPPDLGQGAYRTVPAFPELRFDWPVRAVHQPHGNRWFVVEREGKLWSFANEPGAREKTLVLDLSARTQGYYDCGLLGLVFHPLYGQAGSKSSAFLYLWYNFSERPQGSRGQRPRYRTPSFNRLSRFELRDPAGRIDPTSELVLIDQYNETTFHEGGSMFFHPRDGLLYLSLGDDYVDENAQRVDRGLFSGILRLDVDEDPRRSHPIRRQPKNGHTAHYAIPNDNPFVDPGGKSLEEFWALGLRSPHVISLDAPSNRLFVADVGHMQREELSVIDAGRAAANFQWPLREGRLGDAPLPPGLLGRPVDPILEYPHAEGDNCIIGGFVYRGRAFPELSGRYLFGDNGSNRVWALDVPGLQAGGRRQIARLPGLSGYVGGLSSLAVDPDGEPVLVRVGAHVPLFRLEPAQKDKVPVPGLLSETGLFDDLKGLRPAPGVVPYEVNLPHWADGARARHFLAVPGGAGPAFDPEQEQIRFAPEGEWSVPRGTVLVQHLDLARDARQPEQRTPLETRVLVRGRSDFYALSYRWRADGSDAELLPPGGAGIAELPVVDARGRPAVQPWAFLGRAHCRQCHSPLAGSVLGLSARQLDREVAYPTARDRQLRALAHAGYLSAPASGFGELPRLHALDEADVSLEERVRSYLDVNCAPCHRPDGARALFDARLQTPLDKAGIVNGEVLDPLGTRGARVVKPRDLAASVLLMRLYAVGMQGPAMPPVGKLQADHRAAEAFRRWIEELPE